MKFGIISFCFFYFYQTVHYLLNSLKSIKMKRITIKKMSNINGGAKCIYHAAIATATVGMGPLAWAINYFSGNYRAVGECWNNTHNE